MRFNCIYALSKIEFHKKEPAENCLASAENCLASVVGLKRKKVQRSLFSGRLG